MALYVANTNEGLIPIGDFPSYQAAYQWAAERYGNDFLGVALQTPAAGGDWTIPVLIGAIVFLAMGKK